MKRYRVLESPSGKFYRIQEYVPLKKFLFFEWGGKWKYIIEEHAGGLCQSVRYSCKNRAISRIKELKDYDIDNTVWCKVISEL